MTTRWPHANDPAGDRDQIGKIGAFELIRMELEDRRGEVSDQLAVVGFIPAGDPPTPTSTAEALAQRRSLDMAAALGHEYHTVHHRLERSSGGDGELQERLNDISAALEAEGWIHA